MTHVHSVQWITWLHVVWYDNGGECSLWTSHQTDNCTHIVLLSIAHAWRCCQLHTHHVAVNCTHMTLLSIAHSLCCSQLYTHDIAVICTLIMWLSIAHACRCCQLHTHCVAVNCTRMTLSSFAGWWRCCYCKTVWRRATLRTALSPSTHRFPAAWKDKTSLVYCRGDQMQQWFVEYFALDLHIYGYILWW